MWLPLLVVAAVAARAQSNGGVQEHGSAKNRVAIIGGGAGWVASAYFLRERVPNARIDLFEKEAELGGRIADGLIVLIYGYFAEVSL
jgi:NADPH-dependent glutamate synthase beta subunit-like oxidoreductase